MVDDTKNQQGSGNPEMAPGGEDDQAITDRFADLAKDLEAAKATNIGPPPEHRIAMADREAMLARKADDRAGEKVSRPLEAHDPAASDKDHTPIDTEAAGALAAGLFDAFEPSHVPPSEGAARTVEKPSATPVETGLGTFGSEPLTQDAESSLKASQTPSTELHTPAGPDAQRTTPVPSPAEQEGADLATPSPHEKITSPIADAETDAPVVEEEQEAQKEEEVSPEEQRRIEDMERAAKDIEQEMQQLVKEMERYIDAQVDAFNEAVSLTTASLDRMERGEDPLDQETAARVAAIRQGIDETSSVVNRRRASATEMIAGYKEHMAKNLSAARLIESTQAEDTTMQGRSLSEATRLAEDVVADFDRQAQRYVEEIRDIQSSIEVRAKAVENMNDRRSLNGIVDALDSVARMTTKLRGAQADALYNKAQLTRAQVNKMAEAMERKVVPTS